MAKISEKYTFNKFELSKDGNDNYIIAEYSKDDVSYFNLTEILDSKVGCCNLSLAIGTDGIVPTIE